MAKYLRGPVSFKCPQCGHQITKSIGSIEAKPKFSCPGGCGLEVDGRPFVKGTRDIEKGLDEFGRKMGNVFKKS